MSLPERHSKDLVESLNKTQRFLLEMFGKAVARFQIELVLFSVVVDDRNGLQSKIIIVLLIIISFNSIAIGQIKIQNRFHFKIIDF